MKQNLLFIPKISVNHFSHAWNDVTIAFNVFPVVLFLKKKTTKKNSPESDVGQRSQFFDKDWAVWLEN